MSASIPIVNYAPVSSGNPLPIVAVPTSGTRTTMLVDSQSGMQPIYIGAALPGTATSAASWQICLLAYDTYGNVTSVTWAGGNDQFVNIWNNRTSLTYS